MKTPHIVAFTWIAMLASACGQDHSNFIDSFCTVEASCCAQAGRPSDGKRCREQLAWITSSAGKYNASPGSACLAEMKALVAAEGCSGQGSYAPWPCGWIYSPAPDSYTRKPGESCDVMNGCGWSSEGPVECSGLMDNSSGRCQVHILGKKGDSPCIGTFEKGSITKYQKSNSTAFVSRVYVCDGAKGLTCTDGTCVPVSLAALGTGCQKDSDCVANAYCSGSGYVCAPMAAVGAGCKDAPCVEGAYCDSTTRRCVKRLPNGSPCSESSVCQSHYCDWKRTCEGDSDLASLELCGG